MNRPFFSRINEFWLRSGIDGGEGLVNAIEQYIESKVDLDKVDSDE